ncbi:MAG TPA: globin [Acidimicrobiales bacterium]|nr:globin [Acidimicrobiales bacterium]|tara:strand:- start:578 stop:994 length:417 start_codon:yes stop_codon:yes gene_type:complete
MKQISNGQESIPDSLHALVGDQWFVDLVDRFYEEIAIDPLLRPMYPPDLEDSKKWLTLFLQQYWGGPHKYQESRGHPQLRMRHMPFAIGVEESAAWMRHMTKAVKLGGLSLEIEERVLAYFSNAAEHMINKNETGLIL